jgi:hypothetical protein
MNLGSETTKLKQSMHGTIKSRGDNEASESRPSNVNEDSSAQQMNDRQALHPSHPTKVIAPQHYSPNPGLALLASLAEIETSFLCPTQFPH